jgi:hypothetical protein
MKFGGRVKSLFDERFSAAQDSLDWAVEAITEFAQECDAFFTRDGVAELTAVPEADPEWTSLKIRLLAKIPSKLNRRASEALVNAKASLDQATRAARDLTTGVHKSMVYFPWSMTPIDLKRLLENRKIHPELWDVFAKHEPYPTSALHSGGNDVRRAIAQMINDRHTVGLGANVEVDRAVSKRLINVSGQTEIPALNWDRVANEAILLRYTGETTIGGNFMVYWSMAFCGDHFPLPVKAVEAMSDFAGMAQSVIYDLKAKCEEFVRESPAAE